MEMKFYRCETCGQIIAIVKKTPVPVMCCGKPMKEIIPGTTDASVEKHVPVVEVIGDVVKVKVGSVAHPMLPEHYIEWVSSASAFAKATRSRPSMRTATCTACFRHEEDA